ncbi:MAG: orotidine 5'-phosphate decarboxylase [Candidatus Portnoybacteria bacterium RIFCSPLOWO2_01_FULL_43_11]|uniref:Orotidine 5'-phosphate decarboxylase n=3 Tax=Candidatus Portnoyibacteriota TaxID=1817913 RepID=A0A1G2FB91_9BACT|nr:MAG: orotidine 5'-phosphate decarboxylase [Candidatus Portnoybacteria bacterium RIFCSPHIGHO2_01_FULL_40_12b]OGZ38977.1 MAG: orotidine 5'-phosphate decarboxylase [Candidatus Portnoybacteria bacterium RIFCSPLOWO2_01_FULL_43_11]OGZ40544.1 MAG: orotidine 5'-phosphate decarboxylase [Candidatus Portnoybacteria bacterium RIFCSPLOWO2_02_FULL_40_15]
MEAKERIIVALDVATIEEAKRLAIQLYPYVGGFKIGLELITSEGGPEVVRHLDDVCGRFYFAGMWEGNPSQIFYDGKFMDISNTVAGAARAVTRLGVKMFNVHCLGGVKMMSAAKKAAEEEASLRKTPRPLILGVTLLTSLDYKALRELRLIEDFSYADPVEQREAEKKILQRKVVELALVAQEAGLDGVIASAQEIELIRKWSQPRFLIVTPAIRPVWAVADDQKRIDTPSAAIKAGADYLVIGRPITQPPKEIGGPIEAVKKIIEEIESVL